MCSDPEDPAPTCDGALPPGETPGGKTRPPQATPSLPVAPLGQALTENEITLLSVLMRYELSGYTASKDWRLIKMKLWVLLNKMNMDIGKFGTRIYDKGNLIGIWNVYVAFIGSEAQLKTVFNDKVQNWSPTNYFEQESSLLAHANTLNSDAFYNEIVKAAEEVSYSWF
jgi:hypothetical protein